MIQQPRLQQTIREPVSFSGFGYWSGQDVTVEFRPAPPDSGVVFVRSDVSPVRRVRATVRNRVSVPRRTNLAEAGTQVEMVEHVLSALAGLQIDNCEVWVDAAEMPGPDGSSLAAVEALAHAGVTAQESPCTTIVMDRVIRVGTADEWIEARPFDGVGTILKYHLHYETECVGRQAFECFLDPATYTREIAPARTFITEQDAHWLRAKGLGDRVTYQDLLVFGENGPLDNGLRFNNECVRHKILDLVGDLALSGCRINAYILAYRSGHRLNAKLVARILEKKHPVANQLRYSA